MFLKHLFLDLFSELISSWVFTFVLIIVLFCSLLALQQPPSLSSLEFGSLSLDCVWCSSAYAIAVVQGSLMDILDWLMLFLSFFSSFLPLQQCKISLHSSCFFVFFPHLVLLYMVQYFETLIFGFQCWVRCFVHGSGEVSQHHNKDTGLCSEASWWNCC